MKNARFILLAFLAFSALIFQGRGNAENAEDAARKLVDKFHWQLSERQYKEIYRESNDTLKNSIVEDDFVKFLEEASRKMGGFGGAELINTIKKRRFWGRGGQRFSLLISQNTLISWLRSCLFLRKINRNSSLQGINILFLKISESNCLKTDRNQ